MYKTQTSHRMTGCIVAAARVARVVSFSEREEKVPRRSLRRITRKEKENRYEKTETKPVFRYYTFAGDAGGFLGHI